MVCYVDEGDNLLITAIQRTGAEYTEGGLITCFHKWCISCLQNRVQLMGAICDYCEATANIRLVSKKFEK